MMTNEPNPQPLTYEEALSLFSVSAAEWEAIKASVERGSRRFWARRGLRDMEKPWTFAAQQKMESETAGVKRRRKIYE